MSNRLKIGLLAEGETELGNSVPYVINPQQGGKIIPREDEGALHTLIRRELKQLGFDCDFIHRHPSTKELKKFTMRTGHSILDKKYLQQIVIAWKPEEIDAIIIVADADDILQQRENQLESGLKTIRDNHLDINEKPINNQSISGLAIKNFETWLLADKETIEDILKVNISELNDLKKILFQFSRLYFLTRIETFIVCLSWLVFFHYNPLEMSEITKKILEDAIEKSDYLIGDKNPQRPFQIRWNLAHKINLEKIKEYCPLGYGKFIISLKELANLFFQPK